MRYKKMVFEWEDDGEQSAGTEIVIVPEYVSAAEGFAGDEILCHVYTDEGADLIVKLLNKHYEAN